MLSDLVRTSVDVEPGVQMSYVESGDPSAAHRVVLVHGIPTSSHMYRHVQATLGSTHHAVAVDLVGFGQSSKPADFDYGLENLSRTFGLLKHHIYGTDPIHLVIHDIGGPIGLGWLLNHLDEVRTLTILNTTVFLEHFRPPVIARLGAIPFLGRRLIERIPHKKFRQNMALEFRHGISDDDLAGYMAPYTGPEGRDAMRAMAATFTAYGRSVPFIQSIRKRLGTIHVPTQVIFGGADRYCVPPNGRAFARAIPHASFECIEGAGHFVAEEQPQYIAQCIAAMTQQHCDHVVSSAS